MTLFVPTPGTGEDKKENKFIKINKKRRSRGYSFEHNLVININALPDWYARRLGGSSTGLPDIVAVNNKRSKMYAIEAKSGMNVNRLYIPKDEAQRCVDIATMFSLYRDHHVLFSFKFSNGRKPIIHHFLLFDKDFGLIESFQKLSCSIDGKCTLVHNAGNVVTFKDLMEFRWDWEHK